MSPQMNNFFGIYFWLIFILLLKLFVLLLILFILLKSDNVSNLFDILLEKKSKYAEYDLIVNDKISLLTKLNEKIGSIFPQTEKGEVKMKYLGLDISDDVKSDYESVYMTKFVVLRDRKILEYYIDNYIDNL